MDFNLDQALEAILQAQVLVISFENCQAKIFERLLLE
jgi:hypothetical protein